MTLTPELIALLGLILTLVAGYIKLERRLIIQEVQQNLILGHLGIKNHKESEHK